MSVLLKLNAVLLSAKCQRKHKNHALVLENNKRRFYQQIVPTLCAKYSVTFFRNSHMFKLRFIFVPFSSENLI